MSGSSAKETRRELRRSMGEAATNAVAEMQKNIANLANSLAMAHQRIDRESAIRNELIEELRATDMELLGKMQDWQMLSRRARLVIWLRGGYWYLIHRHDDVQGWFGRLRWLVKPL